MSKMEEFWSMARKMPVRRLMPPGRRTSIFRMKEAVPSNTDSPRMVAE